MNSEEEDEEEEEEEDEDEEAVRILKLGILDLGTQLIY